MTSHPKDSPEVAAQRKAFERLYAFGDTSFETFSPGDRFFLPGTYVSVHVQARWRAFQAGAAWQRVQDK